MDFAAAARVQPPTVSGWLRGKRAGLAATLRAAKALDVTVEWLQGESSDNPPTPDPSPAPPAGQAPPAAASDGSRQSADSAALGKPMFAADAGRGVARLVKSDDPVLALAGQALLIADKAAAAAKQQAEDMHRLLEETVFASPRRAAGRGGVRRPAAAEKQVAPKRAGRSR